MLEIPPFYVGQEIVAIRDHSQGAFKKGDEFKVTSIKKSLCGCNLWLVTIGILAPTKPATKCRRCGAITGYHVEWLFGTDNFAPKIEIGEFVSMKEVLQLELISAN